MNGAIIGDTTNPKHLMRDMASHKTNGRLRADVACQFEAETIGLRGMYLAVLATRERSLRSLVGEKHHHLPVVNIKVSMPITQKAT